LPDFKLQQQLLHLSEVARHANSCLGALQLKKTFGYTEHSVQQHTDLLC